MNKRSTGGKDVIRAVMEGHWTRWISARIFKVVDSLFPKDPELAVFSGANGVRYGDNSRFLYEAFLREYPEELKAVWVTRDGDLAERLGGEGRPAVYQHSVRGIFTLLRAKFVFCSFFDADQFPGASFSRRTVTIQLWHGIPIKTIGGRMKNLDEGEASRRREIYQRTFTYWICSSGIERDRIASCTGIPPHRLPITGYPRNDYLISELHSSSSELLQRFPMLREKVILYAPTFREGRGVDFFPFDDFSKEELDSFLEENGAYLLLREHHMDDLNGRGGVNAVRGKRIKAANRDALEDLQELLPHVDIMVSDYSGAWVDYLLLNRPIVFVPYDLETYERERGLLFDYWEVTPGPKVHSFGEFLSALQEYLGDPARDSDARLSVKKMFHRYEDGRAFSRIRQLMREHLRSESGRGGRGLIDTEEGHS